MSSKVSSGKNHNHSDSKPAGGYAGTGSKKSGAQGSKSSTGAGNQQSGAKGSGSENKSSEGSKK